ncbi:hypothetical protein [Mesobacillus selenatarsenatis]|uniref:Uncharacterized protein n=1 Tax=Mesobacillus selenatarsenatis (strain DSM 18680 / JCM 14380 / FERM P-15431 / SF-1) TaxID=1321606 RepID=A0A0A8WZN1_MESS1|nr:hypothetical protein [Mesobacillus selenatarsenatis]GAM13143.1 hypothetical protein SAMD00020551_1281 [Mesobacillus selenatarsenatis SF-1]
MPRKPAAISEEQANEMEETDPVVNNKKDEIENLNRLLAAVLDYLSDDEVEVIDIEYLLENTEGLREWWNQYRERNRKKIEEEITQALGDLSIEELENLREKIRGNEKE